jgi:hypothetical protein
MRVPALIVLLLVSAGATAAVPPAPANLIATHGSGKISLQWTAAAGATSYSVFEGATPGGESTTAMASGITTTKATIGSLTNDTRYYFTVRAVNGSGTSVASNEATTKPEVAYYLPFASSTNGKSGTPARVGLFVVPALNPAGARRYVGTTEASYVAGVRGYLSQGGSIYARVPYGMLFIDRGADNALHLYRVSLAGTSKLTSQQVSNLSIDSAFCASVAQSQTDLRNPATSFFILQFAGADATCGTADDPVLLVHYGDSATTAPTVAPLDPDNPSFASYGGFVATNTPLISLYGTTGQLSALVLADAQDRLTRYADTSFASPHVLLSGISGYGVVLAKNGYAFIQAVHAASGKSSLYRIDATHLSASLYDFHVGVCGALDIRFVGACGAARGVLTPDAKNLVFTDNAATFDVGGRATGFAARLLRVGIGGATAAHELWSTAGDGAAFPSPAGGARTPKTILPYGYIGSKLLLALQANGAAGDGDDASLGALDAAAAAGTAPSVIATLDDGYFGAGLIAANRLLVNVHRYDTTTGNVIDVTARALDASGQGAGEWPQSEIGGATAALSGSPIDPQATPATLLLLKGYTAPQPAGVAPDLGGAALTALDAQSLALTPLLTPAGAAVTLRDGEDVDTPLAADAFVATDSLIRDAAGHGLIAPFVLDQVDARWRKIANPAASNATALMP